MIRTFISLLPPVCWTIFIAFISLVDNNAVPSAPWLERIHADKIIHAFLYAVLFFLYVRAGRGRISKRYVMALSSLTAASTGIVIEMLQWIMPSGRHFDMLDIMANITGIVICAAIKPVRST